MGKYFCPNFRPHLHSKHLDFKTQQYIENLKNAQNAQMIGLNSGQDISHIPPPMLQGELKTLILPNFTLLGDLVSKRSNRSKI